MSRTPERFDKLLAYLGKIPGVEPSIGAGKLEGGRWWVKLIIDIEHPLAWRVVQELGHLLNEPTDELPSAVFKPVSPPPDLNGGPAEFLSWLIESTDPELQPDALAEKLGVHLPHPVDEVSAWELD